MIISVSLAFQLAKVCIVSYRYSLELIWCCCCGNRSTGIQIHDRVSVHLEGLLVPKPVHYTHTHTHTRLLVLWKDLLLLSLIGAVNLIQEPLIKSTSSGEKGVMTSAHSSCPVKLLHGHLCLKRARIELSAHSMERMRSLIEEGLASAK